jgi:hypothetical protein
VAATDASALSAMSAVTGSVASGVGLGTGPGGEIRLGPLTGGPGPDSIFQISNLAQIRKFKIEAFMCSKNIQTLNEAIFEYFKQISQLGQLQILNRIYVINSGTKFNLNPP